MAHFGHFWSKIWPISGLFWPFWPILPIFGHFASFYPTPAQFRNGDHRFTVYFPLLKFSNFPKSPKNGVGVWPKIRVFHQFTLFPIFAHFCAKMRSFYPTLTQRDNGDHRFTVYLPFVAKNRNFFVISMSGRQLMVPEHLGGPEFRKSMASSFWGRTPWFRMIPHFSPVYRVHAKSGGSSPKTACH